MRSCRKQSRCMPCFEALEDRCLLSYAVVNLLGVSSSGYSRAFNVNDAGLVVGESAATGHVQAVAWKVQAESSSVSPVLLPGLGEGASTARDVNNARVIAGQASEVSSQPHAVVWTPIDTGYVVHDLGPGWAGGISEPDERGIIWVTGSSAGGPVVWTIDVTGQVLSVIELLPTLTVGMSASANDVAVVGSTVRVAGTIRGSSSNTAVFWDLNLDGTILTRAELPGASLNANISNSTEGIGVSSRGDVVGRATFDTHSALQGFLFSGSDETFASLGSLGNEGSLATSVTYHAANGTDEVLWITGHYFNRRKNSDKVSAAAFVWQNGAMTDLYSHVSNRGQWQGLTFAWDVNESGAVVGSGIVGKGLAAHEQAYLAVRVSDGGNDGSDTKGGGDARELLAGSADAKRAATELTTDQIQPPSHQAFTPDTGHITGWRQRAKWASIDAAVVEWALSKKKQ